MNKKSKDNEFDFEPIGCEKITNVNFFERADGIEGFAIRMDVNTLTCDNIDDVVLFLSTKQVLELFDYLIYNNGEMMINHILHDIGMLNKDTLQR